MIPANFDYESPRTLSEALDLLASHEEAKILAGGHSLLPAMKLRLAAPSIVVDLGRIAGLNHIRDSGDRIVIGATTPHADVASYKTLPVACPLLAQDGSHTGAVPVHNRRTIGGSPAAAQPPAHQPV